MPAGLQVFDQSGNLFVDVTTRLTRLVSVMDVQVRRADWTTVSVPGMEQDSWFVFVTGSAINVNVIVENNQFRLRRPEQPSGGTDPFTDYKCFIFRY